jgi:exopolysaccharide biosynthesis protein
MQGLACFKKYIYLHVVGHPALTSYLNMKVILRIAIALIGSSAYAQTDSIAVADAEWLTTKISKGVVLKRASFNQNLFASNQYISILEIKQKRRYVIDLAYEDSVLRTTSDFGKTHKAVAAVNGTFFNMAKGGSVDYLRADGSVINDNVLNKDGSRALHQKAAIAVNKGKLSLLQWDGSASWESSIQAEDVMVTGPLLLRDRSFIPLDSASFNIARHPRSLIAKGRRNKVYFIVIDGRRELAEGMSLFEARKVLKWLKLSDGINLDGGGSSVLWVADQDFNGVVSYPSDNKKWDHEGQRKVANVILLKNNKR